MGVEYQKKWQTNLVKSSMHRIIFLIVLSLALQIFGYNVGVFVVFFVGGGGFFLNCDFCDGFTTWSTN